MEKNLDLGMQYTEHLQQKIFQKLFIIRQVSVNIISWIGRPIPNNVSTYRAWEIYGIILRRAAV